MVPSGPWLQAGGRGAARILALPSSNCMTSGKLRISLCLSFLIFANDCGGTGDRLTGLSRLEGLALRLAVSRVRSWRCEFAGAVRAAFCPSSLLVPRSRNSLVWSGAPSSLISVVSSADMDVVARDRRPMVHQGSFQNKDWDVLSFPGRPHKLPQTWWLKATEVVLSQFWSQSEKSGCRRGALPWGSREAPACPFQLSRAPVCSWPRGSSVHVS